MAGLSVELLLIKQRINRRAQRGSNCKTAGRAQSLAAVTVQGQSPSFSSEPRPPLHRGRDLAFHLGPSYLEFANAVLASAPTVTVTAVPATASTDKEWVDSERLVHERGCTNTSSGSSKPGCCNLDMFSLLPGHVPGGIGEFGCTRCSTGERWSA